MLIFEERGKPENREKTSRGKNENEQLTQPTYDAEFGNRTGATLVGGECSHHCANPAPHISCLVYYKHKNTKEKCLYKSLFIITGS